MKHPAVFLDRDGVLNEEKKYISCGEELRIYDYAPQCVEKLHKAGYLVIVITNQSGIARGYFTEGDLGGLNDKLISETKVDDIFFCPHYENGIVPKYSGVCTCRKPQTGLISEACKKYAIELSKSVFVGDRESDIQTGLNAGLTTILVRTGYGSEDEKKDTKPDYVCDDLRDAAEVCVDLIEH